MNFHRKKREKVDIMLVSMIDVLFVLLLFFIVSTTFNRQTEVNVKLPEANGAEAETHEKMVTLIIDADGVYYLKGEDGLPHELVNQSKDTLRQELQKIAAHSSQLPFIINADGKTPHQAVIAALDSAGQAGFTHISFATEESKTEK
ncbi:ExbD/TolR family protein [Methylobacter sp. YRD-M1]|uniref:ExbD/TolR family protein n=1 Tax=Methylobacter sp. YRD-M1 TaxID=2911520 RepID=UPI00227D2F74|nr:biopolymer transporter ExbD [Methylobacter sp. YRD-M1]WAK00315.1 biopolymer transporter ExbD [Methylobacter sp. YRD-M1]